MADCVKAASLLKSWDNVLVISHAYPDGDTLGSAAALLRGLCSLGKQVKFFCADRRSFPTCLKAWPWESSSRNM